MLWASHSPDLIRVFFWPTALNHSVYSLTKELETKIDKGKGRIFVAAVQIEVCCLPYGLLFWISQLFTLFAIHTTYKCMERFSFQIIVVIFFNSSIMAAHAPHHLESISTFTYTSKLGDFSWYSQRFNVSPHLVCSSLFAGLLVYFAVCRAVDLCGPLV